MLCWYIHDACLPSSAQSTSDTAEFVKLYLTMCQYISIDIMRYNSGSIAERLSFMGSRKELSFARSFSSVDRGYLACWQCRHLSYK